MFNSIQQRFLTPNYKNIAFKGNGENKTGRGSSGNQPASEDVYTGRRGSSPAPTSTTSTPIPAGNNSSGKINHYKILDLNPKKHIIGSSGYCFHFGR